MANLPRAARGAFPVRGPARRARAIALLALAWLLVACGGRSASPSTQSASQPAPASSSGAAGQPAPAPASGTSPGSTPATTAGASPAARPGARAPAGAVTEAECQALLAHVVAIANRAHASTVTPETAPTDAQLADIRARMAPEFLPMCMSLDRATLACQMRASTRDELLACM